MKVGRNEDFSRSPRLVTLTDFQGRNVSVFRAYNPATEVLIGYAPRNTLAIAIRRLTGVRRLAPKGGGAIEEISRF